MDGQHASAKAFGLIAAVAVVPAIAMAVLYSPAQDCLLVVGGFVLLPQGGRPLGRLHVAWTREAGCPSASEHQRQACHDLLGRNRLHVRERDRTVTNDSAVLINSLRLWFPCWAKGD
jgi:hypothetical protein